MSTTNNYIRSDEFSIERSEIVKLDRDEHRCDDREVPVNLEECYQAYAESQVCY